jgi:hypothetical protein
MPYVPRRTFLLTLLMSTPCITHAQAPAAAPPSVPGVAEMAFRQKQYADALTALRSATTEKDRFYVLGHAAKMSLEQGNDAEAKAFAEELELLTPKFKGNWNYGNAIQDANIVLGRLALKAGDSATARQRLLAAGHSPGSPQMNSFGPNMTLAQELLAAGEKETFLAYLELCRKFWTMEGGRLNRWKKDVEENRPPDFGANLVF